jgi:hypothetical protein
VRGAASATPTWFTWIGKTMRSSDAPATATAPPKWTSRTEASGVNARGGEEARGLAVSAGEPGQELRHRPGYGRAAAGRDVVASRQLHVADGRRSG